MPAASQQHGHAWEKIIEARARSNGLLALKNGSEARFGKGGFVNVVKSDLDFKLFARDGRVAFFDAKSYGSTYFTYGDLGKRPHQIDRALLYEEWGVNAGFLVFFRPTQRVAYYPGRVVARIGPGERFIPELGVDLGTVASFDLRRILGLITRPLL